MANYGKRFHDLPFAMCHMLDWHTLNLVAMLAWVSPSAKRRRISATSLAHSFALVTNWILPLKTASLTLSHCVPGTICEGLMQGGLSHLWRKTRPFAIGPKVASYATR